MSEDCNTGLMVPVAGVPRVRVVDEDGNVVLRGWYICHENRQPYALDDELKPEDVDHLVAFDEFVDWGMDKRLKVIKITPPHRIEVIPDTTE